MGDVDEGEVFEVTVDETATSTRMALRGDLDIATARTLEAEVTARRPFRSPLVLDVAQLTFVDSSGLRSLTAVRRAAVEDVAQPVTLVGCRPNLRTLLELTGLEDAFEYA